MSCTDSDHRGITTPGEAAGALAAAVAAARRRLEAGGAVDLAPLQGALAALPTPEPGDREAAAGLVALLDELAGLAIAADAACRRVGREAQALARHRHADAAYAALGRRP